MKHEIIETFHEEYADVNVVKEDGHLKVKIELNEKGKEYFSVCNGHTGKVREEISSLNNDVLYADTLFGRSEMYKDVERVIIKLNRLILRYGKVA